MLPAMVLIAIAALLAAQVGALNAQADRCLVPVHGGLEQQYVGDRRCYQFDAQRGFTGIWANQFEGSFFFAGARSPADVRPPYTRIWLTTDELTELPSGMILKNGHAYLINFIGRRAKALHPNTSAGFGHLGDADGLILVDRVMKVKDLGLLPPGMGWPPIVVHEVR